MATVAEAHPVAFIPEENEIAEVLLLVMHLRCRTSAVVTPGMFCEEGFAGSLPIAVVERLALSVPLDTSALMTLAVAVAGL